MNVRPAIRYVFCSDHDPIEGWQPEDVEDVVYWLDVVMGPEGTDIEEIFTVPVCTPFGLEAARQRGERFDSAPTIVVHPYSWSAVEAEVRRRVGGCEDSHWQRVVDKLRRWFRWEYDGMAGPERA